MHLYNSISSIIRVYSRFNDGETSGNVCDDFRSLDLDARGRNTVNCDNVNYVPASIFRSLDPNLNINKTSLQLPNLLHFITEYYISPLMIWNHLQVRVYFQVPAQKLNSLCRVVRMVSYYKYFANTLASESC